MGCEGAQDASDDSLVTREATVDAGSSMVGRQFSNDCTCVRPQLERSAFGASDMRKISERIVHQINP